MDFTLSTTQQTLVDEAREFALREVAPYAAKWDQDEHIPRSQIQKYADAGYFGLTIPTEYGGHGLTALDAILVIEEIARHCGISGRLIVDHILHQFDQQSRDARTEIVTHNFVV